jgi:hypothetical protein
MAADNNTKARKACGTINRASSDLLKAAERLRAAGFEAEAYKVEAHAFAVSAIIYQEVLSIVRD